MARDVVRDYGADPSGQADTNAAFGHALCIGGGRVDVPAGVYRLDNPVHVHARFGQRSPWLNGEGQNASIIQLTNPTQPAFIFGDGPGLPDLRWPRISDMQIVYMSTASVDVPMFVLQNVKGFQMENCWLREYRCMMQVGVQSDGLARSCEDVHLVNIKGDGAPDNWYGGQPISRAVIRVDNVNGLTIHRSNISGSNSMNQTGIHFNARGTTTIDTVYISHSLFKDFAVGVRAGEGTASNVMFDHVNFDKIESVAVHMETVPGVKLTNFQFDGCWYHSKHVGVLASASSGGEIIRGSINGGSMDQAPHPFLLYAPADVRRTGI